jgi:3-keto-5-aminohexanoate cleavage enzyme
VSKPLIIEVGLNESAKKEQNPTVAYSPEEIAADTIACAEAGASIIHFHAREPQTGANRMNDTALYLEAFRLIRDSGCDVQVYPTYEPMELDIKKRFQHVMALAQEGWLNVGVLDMGSFNLIQFVDGTFGQTAFMPLEASVYQNSFQALNEMLVYYAEHDLIPNLAVFEPGHLQAVYAFIKTGVVQRVPLVKLFFSQQWLHGTLPDVAGLESYVHIIEQLGPDDVEWMTVCYAMHDKRVSDALLARSIELGGHVRVGVGDLPVASAGKTNAELVAEIVEVGKAAGRRPATPQEVLDMSRKLA